MAPFIVLFTFSHGNNWNQQLRGECPFDVDSSEVLYWHFNVVQWNFGLKKFLKI